MDVVVLSRLECPVKVSIAPFLGAEVSSVTFKGRELVHRGGVFGDPAPGDWYGHGQLLWPAVGRSKDGRYTCAEGDHRPMQVHGFAKEKAFTVVKQSPSSVTLLLSSGAAGCAEVFPFSFDLQVTYSLEEDGRLTATHTIHNCGDDNLPFAIGNHITFAFPFPGPGRGEGARALEQWHEGRLFGSVSHQLGLSPGSLLDGTSTTRPEFASPEGCPLAAPGCTDGVFSLDVSNVPDAAVRACSLTLHQPGDLAVTIAHEVTHPGGASASPPPCDWGHVSANRLFVLWGTPPDAASGAGGFLCPEPWVSGPDSLNTREGLPVLAPGQHACWTWSMSIKSVA